jgi:hypothetical protein
MVANVAMGALTASGVGIPAAGGIAVCLIIVHKLMKKYKQLKELQILLLDMNTILTNCYYLENMINKVLTVFQIYINDFSEGKKYYNKIITVDEYYSNLNNAQSCKNIAILVEENKKIEKDKKNAKEENTQLEKYKTNANEENYETNQQIAYTNPKAIEKNTPSDFLKNTKELKGYNLGERIQNAKQLFINTKNIDAVITAEQSEYKSFRDIINIKGNYINIDDDDALESLLKFMIYERIKKGLDSCSSDSAITNFYDEESKIIYKVGVNPDIKYRIKQKLDIIRDLLIEIDPKSAQNSRDSVELNESLDKIEQKAFNTLVDKQYSELIT